MRHECDMVLFALMTRGTHQPPVFQPFVRQCAFSQPSTSLVDVTDALPTVVLQPSNNYTLLRPIHSTTSRDTTCDLRHLRRAAITTHGLQSLSCLRHPYALVVLCTCTARAPRVETVLHLCMSHVTCHKS